MKKFLVLFLAASLSATLAGCAGSPVPVPIPQEVTAQESPATAETKTDDAQVTVPGGIGEAAAKEIALKHAGLTEADVTYVQGHMEYDDGRKVYEIAFYAGNTEYDYEIDSQTGDILSFDADIENYAITPSTSTGQTANIGQAAAKEIALKHAGLSESDVTFMVAWLDRDAGRQIYEVEFFAGMMEYSYEIDAQTGDIWEFDVESIYD